MILVRDNLYLKMESVEADGMSIFANDGTKIADILWDAPCGDCCIRTVGDRLQTYVATYETYADCIYLIDEAYRLMRESHKDAI